MDKSLSSKRGHDQVTAGAAAAAPSKKENESSTKRPKTSTNKGDDTVLMLCAGCKESKPKVQSFSIKQRKKGPDARCKDCNNNGPANSATVAQKVQVPLVLTCSKCKQEKQRESYSANYWRQGRSDPDQAICNDCNPKLFRCVACNKSQSKNRGTLSLAELAKATSGSGEDITCQKCETLEEQRKLAQPRKCSDCGEFKSKKEYSFHQWSYSCYDGKQTCKACYAPEKEEADIKEANRKEKQQELIKMAAQGVYFYDFGETSVAAATTEPIPAKLEGSYSIIFHHGFCGGQDEASRTAKGTLTFAPNPESGKLVGQIEFDKTFPAGNSVTFNPTYKIVPTDSNERDDDDDDVDVEEEDNEKGLEFKVEDLDDPDEMINSGDDEQFARLTVVTERVGLPWKPIEYTGYALDEKFCKDGLVKFGNLEEAEALTEKYEERTPPSWIHDRLGQEIAKRIYEYIPRGPPPVFFLEPGDLCLYTLWYRDFREGDVASYIIARKI